MKKLVIPAMIFSLLFPARVYSQSASTGTWGIATIVLPGSTEHRWGGYAEFQLRTDKPVFRDFFYDEVKAGISYTLDNNYVALLGAGRYSTYDYQDLDKGVQTAENRVWEQLTFTQYLSRIRIEHRYRAEQRWVNDIYRNRFRYRLNAIVPLNRAKVAAGTFFLSAFDEIFLNNRAPHFERNRVSAAAGYQFSPAVSLQAGWLNQYNYSLSNAGAKNNAMLNFVYQILRKKTS
jgi:hypothetical protein